MRISRADLFMQMAQVVAKRSTCYRLNVGAVVTIDNRVVSIGYNGVPPGEPHCRGNNCPGRDGCHETIHAEANAIAYIPQAYGLLPRDLYVTDSPCLDCANLIIKSRVKRVFFATPYRDLAPVQYLIMQGVQVYRVLPSGMVIDWNTGDLVDGNAL